MKLMLACGEMFEGSIEDLVLLKKNFPEKFVAPTVPKGQGSNRTESEKEKWNKGRLFGKIYQLVVAESEVNALLNGKTDFSMFNRSEVKDILKAETQEKIKAKCKEYGLDYEEHYQAWLYKKECDKKSKK